MDIGVWSALVVLFLAGGLTPGPAVMLVTTSSMRYGFWPAMAPALGICAANLVWVALAATGASALAHAFPLGFTVLKVIGVGYIAWIAWRMAFHGAVDLTRRQPPPRGRMFTSGVTLQLANPNALVFFGGLLPGYIDAGGDLVAQVTVIMATLTATELFGLVIFAAAADWLAKRFASKTFALWFYRAAALAMAGSAAFAVWMTWASTGS